MASGPATGEGAGAGEARATVAPKRLRSALAGAVGLLVLACLGLLVALRAPGEGSLSAAPAVRPGWLYGSLALGFAGLLLAGWCSKRGRAPRAALQLSVAALLRLLLLPVPPSLSNDVYRYLWDGRVVAAGMNPYALAPEADALAGLRTGGTERAERRTSSEHGLDLWERMSHRDVEAVYPPVAVGLFSIAALLPGSLLVWKLLLAGLELGGCALLVRVQAARGGAVWPVLLYAWNPLVVLEVAGMAHLDGAALLPLGAAVLLLSRAAGPAGPGSSRRAALAAVCAVVGVLIKLVPAVLLPLWARRSSRPVLLLGVAGALLLLVLGPLLLSLGGIPPGLVRYGVSWEFNGPLFEPLWRGIERAGVVAALKGALDRAKALTGAHELWNRLYPFVYPQLLAKALLLVALLGWVIRCAWCPASSARSDLVEATGRTLAGALLCSAVFYPWYVLWVLPWAALLEWTPWLVLSATLALSYLPQLFGVELFPWVWLAVWLPPALVWMAGAWRERRRGAGA